MPPANGGSAGRIGGDGAAGGIGYVLTFGLVLVTAARLGDNTGATRVDDLVQQLWGGWSR